MITLRDVPLRKVPVAAPETALDEAVARMNDGPLKTVVLVGDGMFMGIFDENSLTAGGIPPGAEHSLLAVGPYAHRPRVVGQPDMPVTEVLEALVRHGQEVLPVLGGIIYRGVATREDLQKIIAAGGVESDAPGTTSGDTFEVTEAAAPAGTSG